jgi:predicted ABC-type transport system involved in lysophospholipase L1 biosynthesis ATPase subunit
MNKLVLECANLHKSFNQGGLHVDVLQGVDLSIKAGERVAIMGASGSGKSTLMNIIGCLDRPSSGSYLLDGRDVSGLSRDELAETRNRTLGFDATDYLYQSRAYAAHDVGSTPGLAGTAAALARVEARVLVMAPPLDLFNPAGDARKAAVGIPGAVFVEIPSSEGHQSASGTRSTDAAFLNQIIARFL